MSIIENTKEIAELVKKVGNIDLYRKIVELEGEIIELSRQKLHLEQKVDELEKGAKLRAQMQFKAPLYYQEGDRTPYCPTCFEKDNQAIHLVCYDMGKGIEWYCQSCKKSFSTTSAIK